MLLRGFFARASGSNTRQLVQQGRSNIVDGHLKGAMTIMSNSKARTDPTSSFLERVSLPQIRYLDPSNQVCVILGFPLLRRYYRPVIRHGTTVIATRWRCSRTFPTA